MSSFMDQGHPTVKLETPESLGILLINEIETGLRFGFEHPQEIQSVPGKSNQWEFQDPKMEVLYNIRPYFLGIFPYIGLI